MTEQPPLPPEPRPLGLPDFLPKRSAGLKLLLVCGLAVLMIIPALLVHSIVYERSSGLQLAINEVSESVGGQQVVLGPVLAVPYSQTPDPKKPDTVVYGIAVAFAETGAAASTVNVEEKQRGIHTIPVFEAEIEMQAQFDPGRLREAVPVNAEPIWSDARPYLGVSDTRGIKDAIDVTVNGRALSIEPISQAQTNSGYSMVPYAGVTLAGGKITNLSTVETALSVRANLRLTGAQRLAVGPFAKDTTLTMRSNWASPSFKGGVLPDTHNVGDSEDGFEATWRVPYLARGIAGSGPNLDLSAVTNWNYRDMAVHFIKAASPYQSVERALKYAAMFIGFVFLAYFLFEVTSSVRAHPAQYVLVG
ncbi:MAG: inner membrane CreD family protein, partial [Pseudomonadota bacterium]